jgi:2-dehydropantoate 2-reductase
MQVHTTVDFTTVAWRKLCINVAGGAITALVDRTLGVTRRPDVAEVARDLMRECIAVGRAEGAMLEDGLADAIVATMIDGPEDASTSMLADRRLGLPLEVDARNGAVARIGARHGIETPLNKALTALLAAIHTEP